MKRNWVILLVLSIVVLFLASCTPLTFSPPMQIHITAGDHVEQSAIAMDYNGISHIAGVVNDRVVYYRTRFGPPLLTLTMTMGASGPEWKQYSPDIAVIEEGHAYLTWVEQRGGPTMYACWRLIPFITDEPYITTCNALDSGFQSAGHVKVVARGAVVYAVYDRITDDGDIDSLRYKELTNPTLTGAVVDYINDGEFGFIFKFDQAIDSDGKLHVVYLDHSGYAPFTPRLNLRSNGVTTVSGDMLNKYWVYTSERLKTDFAPSLTFYQDVSGERVAAAFGWVSEATSQDVIFLARCYADDYSSQLKDEVVLPPSWSTHSTIGDVKLLGIEDGINVSFIGNYNSGTGSYAQVYQKDALDTSESLDELTYSATYKTELEMLPLVDESTGTVFWTAAWLEFNGLPKQFYVAGDGGTLQQVMDVSCEASFEKRDEIATNDVHFANVMEACGDTWFIVKAYVAYLPLINR